LLEKHSTYGKYNIKLGRLRGELSRQCGVKACLSPPWLSVFIKCTPALRCSNRMRQLWTPWDDVSDC